MSEDGIICRATFDTFVRLGIVTVAFLGFAFYFFYDGAIGYRHQNEVIFSYKAFAKLGAQVPGATSSSWRETLSNRSLIEAEEEEGELYAVDGKAQRYPLPKDCEAARSCPPEALDFELMNKGWSECWAAYSERMRFPIKPGEHPYDEGAIREQWIAGGVFILIGVVLLALGLRIRHRVLALQGGIVTAGGMQFPVADIEKIDLRQWGPGFKGVAYFTVWGRKVRVDGMTYGGFNKNKGEPAERFMKAVLEAYKGEIIEYETPTTDSQGV